MGKRTVEPGEYFVVTRGLRYLIEKGVADQFRESEMVNYDCSDNNRVFRALVVRGRMVAAERVFDGDSPGHVGQKHSFCLDAIEIVLVGDDYAEALIVGPSIETKGKR